MENIKLSNDVNKTQHFTTKSVLICNNLIQYIPSTAKLIEPFVGNGDLLSLFPSNSWEKYDIDIQDNMLDVIQQDTLENPPVYTNKWVITNPPYLAKNKAQNNYLYNKYGLDDLYKIAIKTIIGCEGGILIIPTNFFCDDGSALIRKEFLSKYIVEELNVYTEPIFDTTTYSICAFAFKRRDNIEQDIKVNIYPINNTININIKKQYNYRFGGELFDTLASIVPKFGRLQLNRPINGYITHLYITTIDKRNERLKLDYVSTPYYGKSTDRTVATLTCTELLTKEQENKLINLFNTEINQFRDSYGNLVFTNYRDYNRKRIEFEFVYKYLTYLLDKI